VTVLEVIRRGSEYLAGKGVDSPRLNAEELLAHLLNLPRLQLYLNFERSLTPAELEGLRTVLKRRGRREPLQHILGTVSFCGLQLAVGPQALVPRPETELLAEEAVRYLRSLSAHAARVLDFGTGSGCLAITVAVQVPAASLVALDLSAEALDLARRNAAHHQLGSRICFVGGDGFAALPPDGGFDLIVSNPPYIPSPEIPRLQPEVRDFDPHLALDGGPDGLGFYRRLAQEAPAWLLPAGRLMVELGDDQAAAVTHEFSRQNWIVEPVIQDYSHRPRVLVAHR
jgi:release factor glutamine methyltransferase